MSRSGRDAASSASASRRVGKNTSAAMITENEGAAVGAIGRFGGGVRKRASASVIDLTIIRLCAEGSGVAGKAVDYGALRAPGDRRAGHAAGAVARRPAGTRIGGRLARAHRRARLRLARRATLRIPARALRLLARRDVRMLELALEHAFWQGVCSAASERELQGLTRSSYVAFYYHRIAGASPDDRLDVPPAAFAAQLRLLRLLRFHALAPEDMLSFHCEPGGVLPRRSYVLTADDAFRDAVDAFAQAAAHRPQMFASTQLLGRRLPWADADAATWDELAEAARQGVSVGSHT